MFRKIANRNTMTTLGGNGYNQGDTTITLANPANWVTETAIVFSLFRKDGGGDEVQGSYTVWGGILIGDTITGLQLLYGNDQAYAPGGTTGAVMYMSSVQMNMLIDGILVSHAQDGKLRDKIVTLAKINGGSTPGILTVGDDGVVSSGKLGASNVDYPSLLNSKADGISDVSNTIPISNINPGNYFIIATAWFASSPNIDNTLTISKNGSGVGFPGYYNINTGYTNHANIIAMANIALISTDTLKINISVNSFKAAYYQMFRVG